MNCGIKNVQCRAIKTEQLWSNYRLQVLSLRFVQLKTRLLYVNICKRKPCIRTYYDAVWCFYDILLIQNIRSDDQKQYYIKNARIKQSTGKINKNMVWPFEPTILSKLRAQTLKTKVAVQIVADLKTLI